MQFSRTQRSSVASHAWWASRRALGPAFAGDLDGFVAFQTIQSIGFQARYCKKNVCRLAIRRAGVFKIGVSGGGVEAEVAWWRACCSCHRPPTGLRVLGTAGQDGTMGLLKLRSKFRVERFMY